MEDLIDFPCSADWLDHYHRQGLTPRSSGRADPEVKELLKRIEKLEENMERLTKAVYMLALSSRRKPKFRKSRDDVLEVL